MHNSETSEEKSSKNSVALTTNTESTSFFEDPPTIPNNPDPGLELAQRLDPSQNDTDIETSSPDNASSQPSEPDLSSDFNADRTIVAGTSRSARVEMVSPIIVQMPKNLRPMPAQGTLAKAILNAGIRPEAMSAISIIHPIITYPTKDGSGYQGFSNLEYAAIFRLQNIQVPIIVIQDAKQARFLRSKPGAISERLFNATNRAERLALAPHLYDIDIWNALFEEPPSDALIADLIGVSIKTLKSHLEKAGNQSNGDEGEENA